MSPACGHLSLFRGKRSVLVSLEVFSAAAGPLPAGPLPSGSWAVWFPALWFTAPPDSRVRAPRFAASPRVRTTWARLRRPASRAMPPGSAWPWSRQPPRCPGPSVRARRRRTGAVAPAGPARMRAARPAREYDIRVSEWEPVPAGARGKGAARLALYRRVKIAFGNLARQAGRPRVRPSLISPRCSQFVTHLKHFPARRDNIVSMRSDLRRCPAARAGPGQQA